MYQLPGIEPGARWMSSGICCPHDTLSGRIEIKPAIMLDKPTIRGSSIKVELVSRSGRKRASVST